VRLTRTGSASRKGTNGQPSAQRQDAAGA
jgi:hypothetical protein